MPLVEGEPGDAPAAPAGRIRNTNKLLTTRGADHELSLLINKQLATTFPDPAPISSRTAVEANGRALAYLAHGYLGTVRSRLRRSTIPHPLVRRRLGDGRAPQHRAPLLTPVRHGPDGHTRHPAPGPGLHGYRLRVTLVFRADVEAQAGAYATGVLVLISSAAVAVTLAARVPDSAG